MIRDNFFGNPTAIELLEGLISRERIPQTLLFEGPEGVGKATLARRFAAELVGKRDLIEQDDLSLPHNVETLAEREKLAPEKRNDDPFHLASHPDFVTFAPEGPLRQISIHQMRTLKERAQYGPLQGNRRVFLIDAVDRANEQAANSLLKTLEEPPPYLIIVLTAENPYDLLPTIRSRVVPIRLGRLSRDEMNAFVKSKALDQTADRIALAAGCPGIAATLDLEKYRTRREVMRVLLECSAGKSPFAAWAMQSEKLAQARSEKLEPYLKVLLLLLSDLLHLREGVSGIRNPDLEKPLVQLAQAVTFDWLRAAVSKTDELLGLLRRNVQKNIALDAMVLELRNLAGAR
ncbi:MAG: DNA polymerase III subunit [Bryobacteraceae bacterium]